MSRMLIALVVLSGAMVVLCLAFWARSNSKSFENRIPSPSGQLGIGYDNGDFRIGAFQEPQTTYISWRSRRSTLDLTDVGPGMDLKMDAYSWVMSIPFGLLIFAFCIPPAWFLLVFQDRREYQRRLTLGLCMNCGYDPRGTPAGRPCPECGSPPRTSRFTPAPVPA